MQSKLNTMFGVGAFISWAFVALRAFFTMVFEIIFGALGKKHEYTIDELASIVLLVSAAAAFSALEYYTREEK